MELKKYGISIQGFTGVTETFWTQLKACLFAALTTEDTDEADRPEEREEREEREEPEPKERAEGPEIPFETVDFESSNDEVANYIKLGETLEKTTEKRSKRSTSNEKGNEEEGSPLNI